MVAPAARAAEDLALVDLPFPPWIAAHRGARPRLENTVPALVLAVEEGADLLEFDVQATRDGALVLHHDATLARLGGRSDLTVEAASLAELAAVELRAESDAGRGSRTGRRIGGRPGERIPTLSELFVALPTDFPVNIELKVRRTQRGRLAELALEAISGRRNVLFSSFDKRLLGELRRRSGEVRLAPLGHRLSPALERTVGEIGAWSVHVARVSAAALAAWQGPPVLVYTVNDAVRARALFTRGVAGLFTDRPGSLRAELGQPGDSGVLSRTYRGTKAPSRSA